MSASRGGGPRERASDRSRRPGPARLTQSGRPRAGGGAASERMARVAERVRAELSDLLLRGEIRDPEARGAIVSAVTVTADLSLARIYVRILDAEPTAERRASVVKALERAKGHVRRELAARLALRSVPELRFAWDDTADKAARLDALLAEVAADRAREDLEREDARDDDPTAGHLPDDAGGDSEP